MKKLLILLVIFAQIFSAQNYRFVYEYRFAPLKSKPDSMVTDYMNLDTDGKNSFFYNAVKFENDSIAAQKAVAQQKKLPNININYSIVKSLPAKSVALETDYKGTPLRVPEIAKVSWKLENEFKNIGQWKAQKAVADYKGRHWIAWFTGELPISDGPYKFSGLPGLIVKIQDSENHHIFELIQIKKLAKIIFEPLKNPKEISSEKFAALEPDYNAAPYIESMNVTKEGMGIQLKNGSSVSYTRSFIENSKNLDEILAKKLGRGDNPIERK